MAPANDDDDLDLTLRVPRWVVGLVCALLVHGLLLWLVHALPDPTKKKERIQVTLAEPKSNPPAPSRASAPTSPKQAAKPQKRTSPVPSSSPVAPVLPPSEHPPENRAILPAVPVNPEPAPPPENESFLDQQARLLKASRPRVSPGLAGPLRPSFGNLDRVANADPRLHDEENEKRMMMDNGQFFRRGLEALRNNWHPDTVLERPPGDVLRRCGKKTQMTFAIAVLDKQGNVVDVDLKQPSDCPELDAEAIATFKRVARFPNPPAGIFVGPDGAPLETARYPVRFMVTFGGPLRIDWPS